MHQHHRIISSGNGFDLEYVIFKDREYEQEQSIINLLTGNEIYKTTVHSAQDKGVTCNMKLTLPLATSQEGGNSNHRKELVIRSK